MKRWILLAAALFCLTAVSGALGEAELVLDGLQNADWIYDTSLLRVSGSNGYSVNGLDGAPLTEALYASLSGEKGYLTGARVDGDGLNAFGLMDGSAQTLIPFEYGQIDVLSAEWALGIRLNVSTAENYDYKSFSGDGYYLIDTVDVYHLPDATRLATLTRADFLDADAVNHCINIENRTTGVITTYDAGFNALGTVDYTFDDDYAPADYTTFRSNGQEGIQDAAGNVLLAPSFYMIYDLNDGYFEVSTGEKEGLVDKSGAIAVPAEYDDIKRSYNLPMDEEGETSGYAAAGYVAVEQDGKLGFVDLSTGSLSCAPTYAESIMDLSGASATLTDLTGELRIVAADGVETPVSGYERVYALPYGSGMFYRVNDSDYNYGMIDWHGNEVFPCVYKGIELSADGQYALVDVDYSTSQLYRLTYPTPTAGAAAAPAAQSAAPDAQGAAPEAQPAPDAGQSAAGGSDAIATLVSSAASLLSADPAGNAAAAAGLLQSAVTLLGADAPASGLLSSAVTLLQTDPAANAASVLTLLDSAAAAL